MKYKIILIVISIAFCRCGDKEPHSIDLGDVLALGEINNDTVYNGLIKFYSKDNHQLLYESRYVNGVLHGERRDFHNNGKLKSVQYYENGKINDWTSFYNINGALEASQYYYYNLKVGPSIRYNDGKSRSYYFYSFDNELLFDLNYDSLKNKKIVEYKDGYFFYYKRPYDYFDDRNEIQSGNEYFIYTPNPPKYKFEYSIVAVDSTKKILSTFKVLDNQKIFSTFSVPKEDDHAAIKLLIYDSLADHKYTLLKILK